MMEDDRRQNWDSSKDAGIPNAAFEEDSFYLPPTTAKAHSAARPRHEKAVVKPEEKIAVGSAQVLEEGDDEEGERGTWGNPIEFLLSCISMSVGLGNVWRFPFTAFKNGGGAFLIPYLVVLLFIGKPLYFLEMIIGQFSSRGSVKVWAVTPIVKGIGYGQAMATWFVVTYYCCLMALTTYYFFASFQTILPWTVCDPSWADDTCYTTTSKDQNMTIDGNMTDLFDNFTVALNLTGGTSSVEQYFTNKVLKQSFNIDDGIGVPDWQLVLCLLFSWGIICLILIKGIASSGKVAYFTAIFPYVVLITLLIRGVTLDGAIDGIIYFIKPQWEKLLLPEVWYAAVTQCFFSLSIGFGPIIMFSSYNPFKHNIYRDATIVSFMDTFTSLLAGVTIFSILGNLAHESGTDIQTVVKGGTGLAFVSYPETIAKFDVVPQLFAVLFFLMLFTLGVGSAASLTGCVISVVCDALPNYKRWIITVVICSIGFLLGLVYVTPGGQFVLDVVDFFGGGFIIFVMAVIETVAICWIYGLKRFLKDVEFMIGIRLGVYWHFTWGVFIPVSLIAIFIYSLFEFPVFKEGTYIFPQSLLVAGWMLALSALIQIPIWGIYVVYRQKRGSTIQERIKNSFKPSESWGPKDPKTRAAWIAFVNETPDHQWVPNWLRKRCPKWVQQKCFKSDSHNLHSAPNTFSHSSQSNLAVVKVDGNPM